MITYTFKDSTTSYGYGYSGYIEDGQLVLCYWAPREGGVYFRGSYEEAVAKKRMAELQQADKVLYNDIEKYFTKHGVKDKSDLEALGWNQETRTILYKVALHMDDGHTVHNVSVRGRSESGVIEKLTPKTPEVLVLQKTSNYNVFAVRSDRISAIEFLND